MWGEKREFSAFMLTCKIPGIKYMLINKPKWDVALAMLLLQKTAVTHIVFLFSPLYIVETCCDPIMSPHLLYTSFTATCKNKETCSAVLTFLIVICWLWRQEVKHLVAVFIGNAESTIKLYSDYKLNYAFQHALLNDAAGLNISG